MEEDKLIFTLIPAQNGWVIEISHMDGAPKAYVLANDKKSALLALDENIPDDEKPMEFEEN